MIDRRLLFAVAVVLIAVTASAQRRVNAHAPVDLQNAASLIKEWAKVRAAEGVLVCRLQAVLKTLTEIDNGMDPAQPNVSVARAIERLATADRLTPKDPSSAVSFQLSALLITAKQIFDPHRTPDIPVQRERFHREVLEPASRLVTPEVISFVERTQQLDVALQAVSQAQSDMSALTVHAIHGDCPPGSERDLHFE
jgi:hypothetical protein